ncbi:MAG TPA: tetratricopeptide repeat protein, partial [Verrucomicrobiae bacterium]|nr:tetratricopeptide repeat protein [Verrucomicrobiae bacterium]
MESATLFTRIGEFENAQRQLDLAEQGGFNEPVLFLKHAELAAARGLSHEAGDWIRRGREVYPDAASLLSWQANQLVDQRNAAGLAALIRSHGSPTWLTPDLLAAAEPELSVPEVEAITRSAQWWFSWQWLPWERLESHSLTALRHASRTAIEKGERDLALESLSPATSARIPDAELWLAAGRLFDLNDQPDEGRHAYELAHRLGLGRPDAAVASLTRLARRADPEYVARELANRLRDNPDDAGLRGALVTALLRMGEITAAERALTPLVEINPNNPSVKDLVAQVKGAKGKIKQARSLYSSLLRGDPTNTDQADALRYLQSNNEWGFASGYEYSVLNNTVGGPDPANWQEAFFGVFYQQPVKQGWGLEYRWFERNDETASQVRLDYTTALGPDWIWRANVAPA